MATLAHDALVIMAVFALLGLPVGTLFFTALLTVIGFSVNDTIVVFDRLREVLRTENPSRWPPRPTAPFAVRCGVVCSPRSLRWW